MITNINVGMFCIFQKVAANFEKQNKNKIGLTFDPKLRKRRIGPKFTGSDKTKQRVIDIAYENDFEDDRALISNK